MSGHFSYHDVDSISRDGLRIIEKHFDPESMTVLQFYRRSSGSPIAVAISVRKPTDVWQPSIRSSGGGSGACRAGSPASSIAAFIMADDLRLEIREFGLLDSTR